MKKFISFVLCAALLVGIAAVPASANSNEIEWDGDPIVFLQGFSGPQLIKDRGLETEDQVWGLDLDTLIPTVIKDLPIILVAITLHAFGNDDLLVRRIKGVSDEIFEPILLNDDGTSKYNVTPYPYSASEASVEYFKATGQDYLIPELIISQDILTTVPENMFFTHATDWRMGQVYNAGELDRFIDEVLELTGKDKVDIYGLSHGGQLGAAYIFYYGTEGKVDNCVLNVPAIGGTTFAEGLFNENGVNFDLEKIIRFATIGMRKELNLEGLAKLLPADLLNSVLSTAMNKCFFEKVRNFGCIWDFMPTSDYEKMKAKYLDPDKNKKIIEASDEMHYNCMANMSKGLKAAQEAGVNVSIMSNCGMELGTGQNVNSDYIIDTSSSSGAYALPLGEHFSQDYVPKRTTCADLSHNHISPSRNIDATACYLPENTWFTYGQYHGQAWWDSYTRSMLLKLLLTDELPDIYADPDYPQFEIAQNPKDYVYATFAGESQGFVKSGNGKLIIRNLSEEYSISLVSVKAEGCEFDFRRLSRIEPGEEIEIDCVKLTDSQLINLSVSFIQNRLLPSKILTRDIWFTQYQ